MIELGTISKLIEEREELHKSKTAEMCSKISDRLTGAFRTHFKAPDKKFVWNSIDLLDGTKKAVLVSGIMMLDVGDVITIEGKPIDITEENVSHYNRYVKFAFPIVMLEVGTVEELVEHIEKITRIGSSVDVTPEDFTKILDKISDTYYSNFVNDPEKLTRLEEMTKPPTKQILGFDIAGLSEDQIAMLMVFEKNEVSGVN